MAGDAQGNHFGFNAGQRTGPYRLSESNCLVTIFPDVYGPHYYFIALSVGVSLIGVVLWGTLGGSMLPMVLKRLGADPAVSSAPFVATLVDVTGLIIYFSVAYFFLRGVIL